MRPARLAVVAVAVLAVAGPVSSASAAAPMIIEGAQAQLLPAASIPAGSLVMSDARPFTTGVEHYTRTVGCGWRTFHYVARCLSLERTPPPAGSTAIYDPEPWALTSKSEQADYCAGMRLAASLARSDGAHLVIAPPTPDNRTWVLCAARSAASVILQVQPYEADTATFMHVLRRATRWARSVRSSVRVAFVLSTNTKYGATGTALAADYAQAEAYLGGSAEWWLNVLPQQGVETAGVPTAEALLTAIG